MSEGAKKKTANPPFCVKIRDAVLLHQSGGRIATSGHLERRI